MRTQTAGNGSGSILNGAILPFVDKAVWFDGPAAIPLKMCGVVLDESFGFTSEWAQEQTDYVKQLARCQTPTDVLQCQWDFLNRAWARSAGQAARLSDALRAHVSADSDA